MCSLLRFLEEVAAELLQNERQLRQRCFSSTVLTSTSNILSDIQEYTYLQMKGTSHAIDSHRGPASARHRHGSLRRATVLLPLEHGPVKDPVQMPSPLLAGLP